MNNVRVRFAPSPTGHLHVGNARTALFNWLFARQHKGTFILRIEDTDAERSSLEYEEGVLDSLRWLGLDWDEGPGKNGGFGPYRQSQRKELYLQYVEKLLDSGSGYYCFCSQDRIASDKKAALAEERMPVYSGRCRSLDPGESKKRVKAGEPAVVRLKTPGGGRLAFQDIVRGEVAFDLEGTGDPVLLRSTGLPAYNFAVVIDDYLMKISHVIRGEDHISNMPRQILTYQALGFPLPQFAHLSMVMGRDNARLSKRHGATSVEQFQKDGIMAEALVNYLALLGWAPPDGTEILNPEALISLFRLEKVSRSAAIFDYDKLHWVNRQHIKKLSPRDKAERTRPYLAEEGWLPTEMSPDHWKWLETAVESLVEKVDRFADLSSHFIPLFDYSLQGIDIEAAAELRSECGRRVVKSFCEKAASRQSLDFNGFGEITKEIKQETGCKGKDLFHPLRIALTGCSSGLELDKLIPLLEMGARLSFPQPVKSIFQRINETVAFIDEK